MSNATMARNHYSPEQLERIADELVDAASLLRDTASALRQNDVPQVLLHGTMSIQTHVPAISDWSGKVSLDAKAQIRAYLAGVPSRAEIHIKQNEQAKTSAARKPRKKPGT